jgi:hypothetical protein
MSGKIASFRDVKGFNVPFATNLMVFKPKAEFLSGKSRI